MKSITLTPKVLNHFAAKLEQAGPEALILLRTKTSGCSGLAYVTEIINTPPDASMLPVPNTANLPIFVHSDSCQYLQGMTLDYQTEGLQSKLVYINPNETGKCGCGESFSVTKHAE